MVGSFILDWRRLEQKIIPQSTISFKVIERIVLNYSSSRPGEPFYAYRIVFEDGTPAYIEPSHLGIGTYSDRSMEHSYAPTNTPSAAVDDQNRRLFTEDPELLARRHVADQAEKARVGAEQAQVEAQRAATEAVVRAKMEAALQAKEKAQRAAAARDYKRRGGVRLGMTPQQVKASNWGAPRDVNRTTDAFGVKEQWVYGDGNYLYFRNGVLTTIQN